ncbi:MAG: discoidin domain-containing protein [Planctomycetes bacterium]|nr:discoidin domain-containing protein [Planctomycetota bacterium]
MTRQRIDDDWLLQDTVRHPIAMTTQRDAAGGCDGIKDGTYGFHTDRDANPWWQVDLGESLLLDRVDIYNRCDGTVEDRAERLLVLLSDDGRSWIEFYRHDGTTSFGQTDSKPLVIPADGTKLFETKLDVPPVFDGISAADGKLFMVQQDGTISCWSEKK